MNLNDLYTQIIPENSRSKENRHPVECATHSLEGVNPSCGDDITLQLRVKDGKIEDAGFIGSGCAIGQQNALPISKSSFCGITDFNGEVDSLKQLCTAVDTADYYLVLKRKISLVYDFKGIEVKLCARLPQNVGFVIDIPEAEALPVKGIAVFIDNIDL